MIRRFLWGAVAGVMFAVICLMAAVKGVADRVLRRGDHAPSRKQSLQEGAEN